MHILHISGDFPYNEIYKQLVMNESTAKSNCYTVYVPIRRRSSAKEDRYVLADNVEVIQSVDFSQIHRLFPRHKMNVIVDRLVNQVDLKKIDLVHAHLLFSGGGVAYQLKKKYGVPYVVSIRNTDMNIFFKYAPHLRKLGIKILNEAQRIFFISPAYVDTIFAKYIPDGLKELLKKKIHIIPNGINDYWLQNRSYKEQKSDNNIVLLYVGEINRNKNLLTTIAVTDLLLLRGRSVHLKIVGSGAQLKHIERIGLKRPHHMEVKGRITSKEILLNEYRSASIFIMPSFAETFGLVYAEAMSQGLPIIYTKGQGIDGYFPQGSVGYACDPNDPSMIADSIEKVLNDYAAISRKATESVSMFRWNRIAETYNQIYQNCTDHAA